MKCIFFNVYYLQDDMLNLCCYIISIIAAAPAKDMIQENINAVTIPIFIAKLALYLPIRLVLFSRKKIDIITKGKTNTLNTWVKI